jgi:hypothetical protein
MYCAISRKMARMVQRISADRKLLKVERTSSTAI